MQTLKMEIELKSSFSPVPKLNQLVVCFSLGFYSSPEYSEDYDYTTTHSLPPPDFSKAADSFQG